MNREVHVRFWERPRVKVPRVTRQSRRVDEVCVTSAYPPIAGHVADIAALRICAETRN